MAKDHGNAASFIAVVHIEMVNGNLGHRAGSPHRHRTLVQQKSKLHDPLRTWAMLAHCDAAFARRCAATGVEKWYLGSPYSLVVIECGDGSSLQFLGV